MAGFSPPPTAVDEEVDEAEVIRAGPCRVRALKGHDMATNLIIEARGLTKTYVTGAQRVKVEGGSTCIP